MRKIADADAVLERLDEHLLRGEALHRRREGHRGPQRKTVLELAQVARLLGEIHLLEHVHAELLHGVFQLERLQKRDAPRRRRQPHQDGEIATKRVHHARMTHLHRHVPTLLLVALGSLERVETSALRILGARVSVSDFVSTPSTTGPGPSPSSRTPRLRRRMGRRSR